MQRLLLLPLLLVALACGGKRTVTVAPEREPSPYEEAYPALSFVPASASYAFFAGRSTDLAEAAKNLLASALLPLGVGPEIIETELRRRLGVNLLAADDLVAAGLAAERSAAVYGDLFPTFILPVADPEAVRALLDQTRGQGTLSTVRHHGEEVYTWRPEGGGDLAVSWVQTAGWLLLHVATAAGTGESPAWLDAALGAAERGGFAGTGEIAAAVQAVSGALGKPEGEEPGFVGVLAVARLGAALLRAGERAGVDASSLTGAAGCLEALAGVTGRFHLGGDVAWDGGVATVVVELSAGAASALREHLPPPPPGGYYQFREGSAVFLDWSLDLAWLEQVRGDLGCPLLATSIGDPVADLLGGSARAYHVAAEDVDPSKLRGRVAGHLVLSDPGLVRRQLERIPGRSWLERKKTIGGVEVRVLGGVPGIPPFAYHLSDRTFTVGVGSGVIEGLLAAGDAPAAGAELVAFGLEPRRLASLEKLVEIALSGVLPWRIETAPRELSALLRRYERLALRLTLDGDSLTLRGDMRRAR